MSEQLIHEAQSLESLVGRVADEFLERQRKGERPLVEEYCTRHPEAAALLRKVLASLNALDLSATGPAGPANGEPASGVLGDFRILFEIGRGGMGVVYEAEQISLARRVALKVLPFAATLDPKQLQRFKNEAQAAGQLHHTNIVPVYYVGSERGVHFYAMQYIEGQSLAEMLDDLRQQAGRPTWRHVSNAVSNVPAEWSQDHAEDRHVTNEPPPALADTPPQARLSTQQSLQSPAHFRTIARLGIQAAEALHHAHELGVVHRDVKPGNLLVDGRGNLWVTDFGLAQIHGDNQLTLSGDLVGTLRYMSPEQALAKRTLVDHRTDIYSLGATLYELLTLEPVFAGGDRHELLRQIAFEEPKAARRHNKSIPPDLETIILKALEKTPADRYATAKEFAEDLEAFVKDEPIRALRPSLPRRCRKWCRRHKALAWAATSVFVLVMLLVTGNSLWWAQQRQAVEQAAEMALRDAERFHQERKFPEALAAATHADALLAGVGSRDLQDRAHNWRADLEMVKALEEIQLQKAAEKDGDFDVAGADAAYAQAFRSYGIDVLGLEPTAASERIRTKHIRVELATGLDDWSHVCWLTRNKDDTTWKNLLVIARAADLDPWRDKLRQALLEKTDKNALEKFASSVPTKDLPPSTLLILARHVSAKEAVALLRQAQGQHPGDFWINYQLARSFLMQPPQWQQAVRFFSAALAARPQSSSAHAALAVSLAKSGAMDEAMPFFEKAIQLNPNYLVYTRLAGALHAHRRLPEAVAAYRKAVALKPDFAAGYYDLGNVFKDQNDMPRALEAYRQAEAAYRKAIELKPSYAEAHYNLANVLRDQQKLPEAVAAYRQAIKLNPNYAEAYNVLGEVLSKQGMLPEAVAACRKAIELKPDFAGAYNHLGIALVIQKKLPEAITAFRQAIELQSDYAEAYCELGMALQQQGELVEGLALLKQGHELGRTRPNWPSFADKKVRQAEHLVRLGAKLSKVLSKETVPDAAELFELAMFCTMPYRQLNAAAAALFTEAFATEPKLAEDLRTHNRYAAACAAALAGCGQGKDAAKLDVNEYARLRGQSLDWMRADLTAWRSLLDKEPEKARPVVRQAMRHRQQDTDFAGVRETAPLAELPEAERQDWQKLWQDVEELRRRAAEPK